MAEFAAIGAGGGLAGVLLAAMHFALWEKRGRLWLVGRYVVGTACLNTGIGLTALLLVDLRLAVVPWCIAGMGGSIVAGLHLWRERKDGAAATALLRRTFQEYERGKAGETRGPDARAD